MWCLWSLGGDVPIYFLHLICIVSYFSCFFCTHDLKLIISLWSENGEGPRQRLYSLWPEKKEWWLVGPNFSKPLIDQTAWATNDWGLAIIVPIYKKGLNSSPCNYHPISLLNTFRKAYSRHLQWKLMDGLKVKIFQLISRLHVGQVD